MAMIVDFVFRWAHVVFGVVWIGMLYYFNFVQTEYFKEAETAARADAMKKLAPRALWYFRWGAMLTFLTGLYLLYAIGAHNDLIGRPVIWIGALAGTVMFLNVWLVIWPNQQVVLGLKDGDGQAAAAKAGLASRTNTLLSGPMLFGMVGSTHLYVDASPVALYICLAIILLLELNALYGKTGPITTVRGVIHSSIALTAVLWLILAALPNAQEQAMPAEEAPPAEAQAMPGGEADAMPDAVELMPDAAQAMSGDGEAQAMPDAAELMPDGEAEAMPAEADSAE